MMRATTRAALALGLAARAGAAPAAPPASPLPTAPWSRLDAFPVEGRPVTEPLVLPDGRVAVFTSAPPQLVVVDPQTGSSRASRLEEPPSQAIAPRIDALGRIVVLGTGGTLFRLGLDGQVRVAAALPGLPYALLVRPDATEVALVRSVTDRPDFVTLRPAGRVAAGRAVDASPGSRADLLPDGRAATAVAQGIAVLEPEGTVRLVPAAEGVDGIVSLGTEAFAYTSRAIFPLGPDASLEVPTPLPAMVRWWSVAGAEALCGLEGGTAVLRVGRHGVVRRIPAPFASWGTLDPTGAILLTTAREGRLTVLEADGRARWVQSLGQDIVPTVAFGPDGEAWVASTAGALLRLSNAPGSAQEAPRANR